MSQEQILKLTSLAFFVGASLVAAPAVAAPAYALSKSTPLGGPERWDYVVYKSGRVYVAHGDKLAVLDARSGALLGEVQGITGGTHGIGVSSETNQGFTDDGRNGKAVAFDLTTLRVRKLIPADKDADAIVSDPATGNIFVIEGDPHKITVIDPHTDTVITSIDVGEGMEYGASDRRGSIFVAGVEKRDLLKIDARTNAVTARWSIPDCQSPHGLALDLSGRRAFVGCVNGVMMVVNIETGKLVANLPIGNGNDAVTYDSQRRRVFSSNGRDGTITAYQEINPDRYELIETVPTMVSGRTMDVDPETGRLFVAAAEAEPNPPPGERPHYRPGTLKLMMFDPTR